MFNWLRKLLKGESHPGFSAPVPHPDPFGAVKWVKADDPENPFGVRIIDCTTTALGLISLSEKMDITERYGRLRNDGGSRHAGMLPPNHLLADCDLKYPVSRDAIEGPLRMSGEMEDKWDIFYYDRQLYFSRSWTGDLIYAADTDWTSEWLVVSRIIADKNQTFNSASMAVKQVDYLIKRMLLGWIIPAPLPPEEPIEVEKVVAWYLFTTYGRHAIAGTYEDTLKIKPIPVDS